MPPEHTLHVGGLHVRYGGVTAVHDVDVSIDSGTVVGLIGPNGAGKTSLIDAVTGFTPYRGVVQLDDDRLDGLDPHVRSKKGLVRTFQGLELFQDISVEENLRVGFEARSSVVGDVIYDVLLRRRVPFEDEATFTAELVAEFDLQGKLKKSPAELSNRDQRILSILRSLSLEPSVLLADEPAAGLSESETQELAEVIRRLAERGLGILLIEHRIDLVMSLCDWIYVLNFGEVIASGDPETVRCDPGVVAAYLGEDEETRGVERGE